MVTEESITDEMIRELRDMARADDDIEIAHACTVALRKEPNPDVFPVTARAIAAARARCAEVWNSRAAIDAEILNTRSHGETKE